MNNNFKNPLIKLENIKFRYPNSQANILDGVDFSMNGGEIVAITGPSGSGKSTLGSIMTGVIPKRIGGEFSGSVFLDGQDITEKSISETAMCIAMMHQNPDAQILFSSSRAEVAFALENFCIEKEAIEQTISKIADILDIKSLLNRNPNTLSGGEKQLVVLASILVMGAKAIVLDEAMAEVDDIGKEKILSRIQTLRDEGRAIVMIEHEKDNYRIADRVFRLNNGKLSEVR